jgi:hypothetical protein
MTDWLEKEIVRGIGALFLLNLQFTPGADAIKATGRIWIGTLRSLPHTWLEDRDRPRIQAAFRTLAATSERWPAPKNFIDALPKIPDLQKLPPPTTRHTAETKKMVDQLLAKLGVNRSTAK